jgi:hypothetical protein
MSSLYPWCLNMIFKNFAFEHPCPGNRLRTQLRSLYAEARRNHLRTVHLICTHQSVGASWGFQGPIAICSKDWKMQTTLQPDGPPKHAHGTAPSMSGQYDQDVDSH